MIGIMSYQYPSPQDGTEIDMPHASYMAGYPAPTTSTLEGTNEDDHGPLGLPNEKKRNKLGYHRTPIACGHCRRRKIRCKQPEIPDVLGRCESCINLKKDCVYHAVNQPPTQLPTTGQRQGTKTSMVSGLESPSTSPAMSVGHTGEVQPNPSYHQLVTMPSMSNIEQQPMRPRGDEAYPAEPKLPSNAPGSRAFDYAHGIGSWVTMEAGASATRTPSDTNSPWPNFSHGLPDTPDYSPYSPHAPASSSTWPGAPLETLSRIDANARLSSPWKLHPAVTRSMSYNGDQSGQFPPPSTRPYDRAQLSMAPQVKIEPVPGMALNAHNGSLSAGAEPHSTYGAWHQPYQYTKANGDYGGWYGEPGEHQPEAHVSSASEDPSQAGGMYYGGR